MATPLRTEVVAHRASRKSAERYIASFADVLGDTTEWKGGQHHPIHLEWNAVPAEGGGFDIVSTVTERTVFTFPGYIVRINRARTLVFVEDTETGTQRTISAGSALDPTFEITWGVSIPEDVRAQLAALNLVVR